MMSVLARVQRRGKQVYPHYEGRVEINGTRIDDTFAEAFRMRFVRLVVTAHDDYWLDAAVREIYRLQFVDHLLRQRNGARTAARRATKRRTDALAPRSCYSGYRPTRWPRSCRIGSGNA